VSDSVDTGTGTGSDGPSSEDRSSVVAGEYTWVDLMREYGFADEADEVERASAAESPDDNGLADTLSALFTIDDNATGTATDRRLSSRDFAELSFSPDVFLGFPPEGLSDRIGAGSTAASHLRQSYHTWLETTPVVKGKYTWEHLKWEYYYDADGKPPRDRVGDQIPFDREAYLGFSPDETEHRLGQAGEIARDLEALVDHRTVDVDPTLEEDEFFTNEDGEPTLTDRYDLEKAVSMPKKLHYMEVKRYWVNKPYVFVVIFHSVKDNEKKYYLVDPYLNELETDLMEFLSGKLRAAIKYSGDELATRGTEAERRQVLESETHRLLDQYDLYEDGGWLRGLDLNLGLDWPGEEPSLLPDNTADTAGDTGLNGVAVRPEPVVLAEDPDRLTEYQVQKLLYHLKRDFVGYERIDGIKYDINVEDISCDGYNSPIFVYHTDYEQMITNLQHDPDELDDFVIKLAQRSGKGISQRRPQVDATLPDGSRAQLTLGSAVSDHGTNYTIRQFKDVPFTPVDLINWNTFGLEQMGFLWLCIENNRSIIFGGGTASGKTTSLNAVSLFIPNNTKVVSIEDTREVELPQRNWVASVTRPSFGTDDTGDIDEFDLLEAGLRQRPDYIVMGEVRGEEGRVLFQIMSTGHTTLTTFHADNVGEVLKRFTTDPINVSKTLFTTLDLVSVQTQTRIRGQKVRRNKALTEINHYDQQNNEINVQDIYEWWPEEDEFRRQGTPSTLEQIRFDRGWTQEQLRERLFERQVVLSYLIANGISAYSKVAATIQGFMNDPESIMTLIAQDQLAESLAELREMESVAINVDPEREALVPRPEPPEETLAQAQAVLERAETELFDSYRAQRPQTLISTLQDIETAEDLVARSDRGAELHDVVDRVRDGMGLAVEAGSSATDTDALTEGPAEADGGVPPDQQSPDATDSETDSGSDRDSSTGAATDQDTNGDPEAPSG
jgi:flagellar protein FlaI